MHAQAFARMRRNAASGKNAFRFAIALFLAGAPLFGDAPAEAQGFFPWWGAPPPPGVTRPATEPKPHKPRAASKPRVHNPSLVVRPAGRPLAPVAQPSVPAPQAAPASAATPAPPRDPELAGIPLDPHWPKQLYVIGDSVMLGAKPYLSKAFPDWQVTFAGRPALMVRKAIEELPPGPLGSVAVVALGYNSLWQKDRQNFQIWSDRFDKNIEDMLSALKQRGVHKIVWVLLRELTPQLVPNNGVANTQYQKYSWYFPYVNERLRAAKERHPDLALADWVTAARQSGITYDAIHLNPRGGDLMVNVVRVAVGLDPLPSRSAVAASLNPEQKAPEQTAAVPAPSPAPPSLPAPEQQPRPQDSAAAAPSASPNETSSADIRKSISETGTIPPRVPLKATYAFRDCASCPEMVILPAASFTMGSPDNESDREMDEGPQRLVTIARPFAVGKFEVTFAEWDACVADGGCQSNSKPKDEGWGKDNQPVVNVSWDDANEYVQWLSRITGKSYRLLTEAEWEYAARAGSTSPFPEGGAITPEQANFQTNFDSDGNNREGTFREQAVTVGSFPPNAFGLHDMEGNVSEWVQDSWHENYAGAPTDGSAWAGGEMSLRVLRGGSWYSFPTDLRSASRRADQPDHRSAEIGFRVARSL
jgi:formylglycine-generating enzyme required for sulfatase activity